MKRSWILLLGVALAIAIAAGFQQVEPLDELRKYGSLTRGVGGVGPDDYSFMPDDMAASRFAESLGVVSRCPSVRGLFVPKMDDLEEALARIAKLEQVTWLWMRRIDADDRDVAALAEMTNLRFLDLSRNPNVTDTGVAALTGLENLRRLDLTGTSVSGTGLEDRGDMVSLEQLTLDDCPVTDESLAAIPRFPKLGELHLARTNVTDDGLMSLVGWHCLYNVRRSALMTWAGSQAFNEAFLAAKRKAREAGEAVNSRDIPPVFMHGAGWKDMPGKERPAKDRHDG